MRVPFPRWNGHEGSIPSTRSLLAYLSECAHGLSKNIESNFCANDSVVVVDDVITTGGSTLQAIDKIEADGGKVAFAIVLVDRQEQNGRANIEARGCPVVSIFNRQDVLAADATKQPHPAAA